MVRVCQVSYFAVLLGVLLDASTLWAGKPAPTLSKGVACELAMMSSSRTFFAEISASELIDRVSQSYRGLLEFAGEEWTNIRLQSLLNPVAGSLEKFFEPIPNSGQRSAAFNSSLTLLGDWVLLEAEERGVDLVALRARLQSVVRELQEQRESQRERHEEIREASREVRSHAPRVLDLTLPSSTTIFQSIVVDNGKKMLMVDTHNHLSLWNLETFELERVFDSKQLAYYSEPLQAGSDLVLASDWTTGEFGYFDWRAWNFTAVNVPGLSDVRGMIPSPAGDWVFVGQRGPGVEQHESYALVEPRTRRVLRRFPFIGRTAFTLPRWSTDGESFAIVNNEKGFFGFGKKSSLEIYRRRKGRDAHSTFEKVFSEVIAQSTLSELVGANEDLSMVIVRTNGVIGPTVFRVSSSGLEKVDLTLIDSEIVAFGWEGDLVQLVPESGFGGVGMVRVFERGNAGPGIDIPLNTPVRDARTFCFSPSRRYLALVQYGAWSEPSQLLLVDLKNRWLVRKFSVLGVKSVHFLENESKLMVVSNPWNHAFSEIWNLDDFQQE